ncbi:MAG: hypothetical protein KUG77_06090 [Nannocystaceae bacterium]|nr:hypothetical protein [Nannocystaceae bacterium]
MLGGTKSPWYPVFKGAVDALCYPIRLLDARGRTGGVVALVLGVGLLAAGILISMGWLGLGLLGLGIAYLFYGLSRLLGNEARLAREFDVGTPRPEPLSSAALKDVLKSRAVPFFVCSRCKVVMEPGDCGGRCLLCGSETDCIPVTHDDDRTVAASSIY